VDVKALAVFAAAIFTILNPIGDAAIFEGMVSGRSSGEKRAIAVKSAVAVAAILFATLWFGEQLLAFFGVSLASLETAGGLIVALIGISMLHSRKSGMHTIGGQHENPIAQAPVAVVPLAMPISAGPGVIATVIANTHKYQGFENNLKMSMVCVGMSIILAVCFLSAGSIKRLLGTAGMSIVTKFMGIILLAIACGMFASGGKGLLPGLAG
jgi:multiple antibiotic resistance protein